MENPTEDQIRAMSNREFASLIRSQAEMIDRSIRPRDPLGARGAGNEVGAETDGNRSHRRSQKQKV
jgi:hypothetical protein